MGRITVLKNNCTQTYQRFKTDVHSCCFNWNYFPGDDATPPHYQHVILSRPGFDGWLMPSQQSEYLLHANEVLKEIFTLNEIEVDTILRISVNSTYYIDGKSSPIHRDHDFNHQNILIYLSSFEGGNTHVYSAETRATHEPKEDDVIVFGGLHSMEQPKVGRRIVLVATYL